MGSQSKTAIAKAATTCYSTFVLITMALTVSYLICAPVAHARWYDPERGRFLSRDPMLDHMPGLSGAPNLAVASNNPKALNAYSFNYNDPLNFVDTDGESPLAIGGGIIIGGLIVAGLVLWLGSEAAEKGLEATLQANCDIGCAAQTANNEYAKLGMPPLYPIYEKKPGAPKSCDTVLCRAAKEMKANAVKSARELVRFWNEYCAKEGSKI